MKYTFFCVLTLVLFALLGCKKDPCKSVDCVNGDCEETTSGTASCVCDSAWLNSSLTGKCTVKANTAFIGYYLTREVCNTGPAQYNMSIDTVSGALDKIIFNDFGQFDCEGKAITATATVKKGTFKFDGTSSCEDITVTGSGSINSTTITMNYRTTDNSTSPVSVYECTNVTMLRQ